MAVPVATEAHAVYDEDHDAFRESVRTHLARTAVPAAGSWARAGLISREALALAAEHGFLAMGVGEEQGGLGVDDVRFTAVVVEEAMRLGLDAFALTAIGHGHLAPLALAGGPAGDRLAGLAAGELRVAVELWPAPGCELRAVAGAADADLLVVALPAGTTRDAGRFAGAARSGAGGAGAGGVGAGGAGAGGAGAGGVDAGGAGLAGVGVVDLRGPGVEVRPWDAPVGLGALGLADVVLGGVVPEPLAGVALADLRTRERLLIAVAAAAGARTALGVTIAYVADRQAFGAAIASFGNTRQVVGELAADLEAADALVARALRATVAGDTTHLLVASAALVATGVHERTVDAGLQLHGGYGYVMEYPIAHHFADARWLRLAAGGTQRLRADVGTATLEART